jgi:hypothetical protein
MLPAGEVGVLDGELREIRHAAAGERRVSVRHLAEEHLDREGIGRYVVHAHEKHMCIAGESEQRRADHQILAQIKRLP